MRFDYTISKPVENPSFVVLSLGAGVQSTVLALMAAHRVIKPMPDYMIFADTGWEPEGVYEHLRWLEGEVNRLTNGRLPLLRVNAGNIRSNLLNNQNSTGQRYASVPFYTENGGMGRRQCTNEYKIEPIKKKIRELAGLEKGQRATKSLNVEQWIGISRDEMQRLSVNKNKYITNRWPLIEIEFRRSHCIDWFNEHYPERTLAKSACIGCPYRDDKAWHEMKETDSKSFYDAVLIDKVIRNSGGSKGKMVERQYIHQSLKPLNEVVFDVQADQREFSFDNECEGMCGI